MGDRTGIEWTDATWNPVTGCTKVSQGCKNCYAERVFPRVYAWQHIESNGRSRQREFTDVVLHHDRLDQPLRWKRPRRIFVNSMSDLFHEAVPDEFIDRVFRVAQTARQHTYQILTKRPARMREFLTSKVSVPWGGFNFPGPWGKRIHLGVSCEDQATADERIPLLLQTPAAVRFVSAEPLLGPIDLMGSLVHLRAGRNTVVDLPALDWVIAGGESGPKARPMHPDWVRSLRDQCVAAKVPFFFKQWGEWAPVCAQYPESAREEDEAESASMCGDICLSTDGYIWEDNVQPPVIGRPWLMDRVGKKAAGALLDGREWKEFPATD